MQSIRGAIGKFRRNAKFTLLVLMSGVVQALPMFLESQIEDRYYMLGSAILMVTLTVLSAIAISQVTNYISRSISDPHTELDILSALGFALYTMSVLFALPRMLVIHIPGEQAFVLPLQILTIGVIAWRLSRSSIRFRFLITVAASIIVIRMSFGSLVLINTIAIVLSIAQHRSFQNGKVLEGYRHQILSLTLLTHGTTALLLQFISKTNLICLLFFAACLMVLPIGYMTSKRNMFERRLS